MSERECQHITSGLAKLGCKVIIQTSVRPLTVSDNPNGVQLRPNFANANVIELPHATKKVIVKGTGNRKRRQDFERW